jgi:hypothetical protein
VIIILYIEDPKDSTRRLLNLPYMLSKLAGYKINIQKRVVFLYHNKEHTEKRSQESNPFTIS